MEEKSKQDLYTAVICPTCGTRVTDVVQEEAYDVECPDCLEPVTIPSRRTVQKKLDEQQLLKAHQTDGETYGVSAVAERVQAQGVLPVEEKPPAREYTLLNCPTCNARLHPELKNAAYYVDCPDCHTEIRVPAEWEVPEEARKKKRKKPKREGPGSYEMGEAAEPPPGGSDYFEKRESIRQETIDPPPNWTFFSNVFEFPWMPGTLSRWICLTLFFMAVGYLGAFTWSLAQSTSGPGGVVLAFFVLPEVWLTIWATTYASACFLPVVIDTASGNNLVRDWPEPSWREWFPQFLYVGYLESVAAVLSGVIATVVESSGGSFWPAFGVVNFLIYPVMLLSSLEAGSVFMPLTTPILKSMATHWWCWLMYYLQAALLWGLWFGLMVYGFPQSPYFTLLPAMPLLAAILLITARLLGRLAWRAGLTDVIEEEESKPQGEPQGERQA